MIRFTCTPKLLQALEYNNIQLEDYKPAYGGESVGMDLYHADNQQHLLHHGAMGIKIPTGLRVIIPSSHVGVILERGSISKTSLTNQAGVIDPGFTGEIWVPIRSFYNFGYTHGHDRWLIEPYQKLPFQLVVFPCLHNYGYITEDIYEAAVTDSKRKGNQIGSSDVKSS